MPGLIVTGTDTGVGKTYFSCLLLKVLREAGMDAVGIKPVCSGDRQDAECLVAAADGVEPLEVVNPVCFQAAVAPAVAAELEGKGVDLADLEERVAALAARHEFVVVEGVGGWEVPMTKGKSFADFAVGLGWPVVLVAANRLGMLNHTILTERAIRDRGMELAALVMNHLEEERDVAMITNRAVLAERFARCPMIDVMPDQDWLEDDGLLERCGVPVPGSRPDQG